MLGTTQWLKIDNQYAVENLNSLNKNSGKNSQLWQNVASEVNYAQQMDQQSTTQQSIFTNPLFLYIIIGILVIALIAVSVYAIVK